MEIKNGQLLVYKINNEYLKYLSHIDKNVRHKDERKYYGIIVTNNIMDYCIPITCKVKKRNKKLTIDIKDDEKGEVIAQLTLNNIIPVHSSIIELMDVNNEKDKDYINKEIRYLRKPEVIKSIIEKTENLFKVLSNEKHPDYYFFQELCGDFNILEQVCMNWVNDNKTK